VKQENQFCEFSEMTTTLHPTKRTVHYEMASGCSGPINGCTGVRREAGEEQEAPQT
jgi:hypothetical protein